MQMHRFHVTNKTGSMDFCVYAMNSNHAGSIAFLLVNNDKRYSFIVRAV